MISEVCKHQNFKHLLEAAKVQVKVRHCEVEGSPFDLERRLKEIAEDKILEVLRGT